MNLFGKKPPPWASGLSRAQYKDFKSDVERIVADLGMEGNYDWEAGTMNLGDGVLGFHNLVAYWYEAQDRETVTTEFLSAVNDRRKRSDVDLTWEEAQPLLMVQIGIYEGMPVDAPGVFQSPVAPWHERLAIDEPDAVRGASENELKSWMKDLPELRAIALENVWRQPVDIRRGELAGQPITMLTAGHFWAAAHTLMLDRYVTEVGAAGYLVSIPNRHIGVFAPVDRATLRKQIETMGRAGYPLFLEAGQIFDDLFWWSDGIFHPLGLIFDSGGNPLNTADAQERVEGVLAEKRSVSRRP